MTDKSSKKILSYYVHENGFIMPKRFPPENFISALEYIPEPSDVFICAYPKCGSTWTQSILYLLLNKGVPLQPGQNINSFIPHLEDVGKEVAENLPKPRIIKCHLPHDLMPKSKNARYIYIMRNPKDCCVSYFHHCKGFGMHCNFENGTFDDFYEAFMKGKLPFGDYFDYIDSWINQTQNPNVLLLLYEEMKSNSEGTIKKIGEFLGEPFSQSVRDPFILREVIQNSSFKVMKTTPTYWSSKQAEGSPGFIRKGKIGDWREHFTQEQGQRMDEKFRVRLSGSKFEHLWDNYDC